MSARNEIDAQRDGAVASLFRAVYGDLHRFLHRRIRDADEADELAQESFTRLLDRGDLHTLADPRPFLFRIAANLATDRQRRHRASPVRERLDEQQALVDLAAAPQASPESAAIARDELQRVLLVVGALPPACRTAFLMRRIDGAPHTEIAKRLGVSTSMVEKHLAFAALQLKRALDPNCGKRPPVRR